MKRITLNLIAFSLFASPIFAEKIPVEGWYKSLGGKRGDSWLDSGKRQHLESAKSLGEISLYSENFSFRATSVADVYLSFLDKNSNGKIIAKEVWTSSKNSSLGFKGHSSCEITGGSTICIMWFKGFGEYDGKIMELSLNEVDVNESNYTQNRAADSPNVYPLEGKIIDEPKD